MPTFQFEAMDATGQEIKDVIDAATEEEAQTTIRQMGYYVTRITVKRAGADDARSVNKGRKSRFVMGGASTKVLTTFTRQLSILQDAGLPILRSLKILEGQCKGGALKNALIDVCDDIEAGSTLSEAMSKQPKVFDRLYVNMIKAGEAGGALEIILQRLAEFKERAESLKRKVKGAMIYPVVVVLVAVGILTFIMLKIVPVFQEMFDEFELTLPPPTLLLMAISENVVRFWFLIPAIPGVLFLFIKLLRKFKYGRMGWDLFNADRVRTIHLKRDCLEPCCSYRLKEIPLASQLFLLGHRDLYGNLLQGDRSATHRCSGFTTGQISSVHGKTARRTWHPYRRDDQVNIGSTVQTQPIHVVGSTPVNKIANRDCVLAGYRSRKVEKGITLPMAS